MVKKANPQASIRPKRRPEHPLSEGELQAALRDVRRKVYDETYG